jgi:hypothetical protein
MSIWTISQSSGINPDVLGTYRDVRWGFACKVPHSSQPLTLCDYLQNGVELAENARIPTASKPTDRYRYRQYQG